MQQDFDMVTEHGHIESAGNQHKRYHIFALGQAGAYTNSMDFITIAQLEMQQILVI